MYAKQDTTVLEAGGGSFTHFSMPPGANLVALDISYGQLKKNADVIRRVQADLHRLPFAGNVFDMVVCFNVIEHLDDPETALRQMYDALRPGGVLLIGCPDRSSLKGLVTRLTPISIHRAFYRYIVGKKDRGGGHYDAFETPFRKVVSKKNLARWMKDHDLAVEYVKSYDGAYEYGLTSGSILRRLFSVPYYLISSLGLILSLGTWNGAHSDILMVATKQQDANTKI